RTRAASYCLRLSSLRSSSHPPHYPCSSSMIPRPARPTLFPYTTLFRSSERKGPGCSGTFQKQAETQYSYDFGTRTDRTSTAFRRSEEHTSELRHQIISYAVFCLKKKKTVKSICYILETILKYMSFRYCY